MGSSQSTTNQSSSTNPWAAATPAVTGLLGNLQGLEGNTGLTSAESGAINTLTANGQAGNTYAPAMGTVATNLLNGGGATAQNGNLSSNLANYQAEENPLASNTNYDPMSTPGIGTQLAALNDQITGSVNGAFAAGGRSGSAMNSKALGMGLAEGEAPVLTAQYNQNVQNQQAAAGNEYNAGNTTATNLTNNTQAANTNEQNGITAGNDAYNANNEGAQTTLAAQELGQQIPQQNLAALTQIGVPLASLGSTSTGTSNTTSTPSLLQMITGLGGMVGSGPSTAASGATSGGSGLLGLLGAL